jgi:hypothetical protein
MSELLKRNSENAKFFKKKFWNCQIKKKLENVRINQIKISDKPNENDPNCIWKPRH